MKRIMKSNNLIFVLGKDEAMVLDAMHIYAAYSCHLSVDMDNAAKLTCLHDDALVIVAATA